MYFDKYKNSDSLIEAYFSKNLRTMGIHGYRIIKKYGWDTTAKKVEKIYESLV